MKEKFEFVVQALVRGNGEKAPLTGIDIAEQFRPEQTSAQATLRNLNAAFLLCLCGETGPSFPRAMHFIKAAEKHPLWKKAFEFYWRGISCVFAEIEAQCVKDRTFSEGLDRLVAWAQTQGDKQNTAESIKRVWQVFFPEGCELLETDPAQAAASLRKRRVVRITRLNRDPITDPGKEILFTSNVLLTLPPPSTSFEELGLPEDVRHGLRQVSKEPQRYWYDHPIQIGTDANKNEIVYGLRGLDRAVAFEKERGTVDPATRVNCLLSVSVTHKGLHRLAKTYVAETLRAARGMAHLRVYVVTGADTHRLVNEILAPAAGYYLGSDHGHSLEEIIGVDGEYGRHFCFLKAVSALWQVLLNPLIRGTFKIDLDQVFPQQALVRETGFSAFEHLQSPLWGAEGTDSDGSRVELGMIAGALVNQKDIRASLFTPDVQYPTGDIQADEWIFFSPLPQAISTDAEMMTRYTQGALNGQDQCIQRFHVTGGTCGILVESLRNYRPFTPSFIGRAEDQAYVLSVLFQGTHGYLRYVHKDGLIMRHDKDAFAEEAIRTALTGKRIGDYARILLFSYYVKGLPWPVERTKGLIDPFTGCFVSAIPFTVVYLRLALKAASLFKAGDFTEAVDLLQMALNRLHPLIDGLQESPARLTDQYLKERQAWGVYYDLLDKLEVSIAQGHPLALELREKAIKLITEWEIKL